jgi:PHD/YefM family antitoxin component YafN of YafNO toxin-antitoxin module
MTNEEKENILDQHKEIYDGYVTSYAQPPKEQPLYTQSYANDKEGLTVNNKGVVTAYKNMGINEMRFDNKSTGLFADEENAFKEPMEQGHVSPGAIYDTEETFESEMDEEYYVSLGEQLDMIGDGDDDLEHGVFAHDDDDIIVTPEAYDDEDYYKSPFDSEDEIEFNIDDTMFDDNDEIDDEEVEGLFEDLKESLGMFKRFTKYN